MKPKAIFFDLDGTLLDSVPIILKAAYDVFSDMGIAYDEPALRSMIGIPLNVQAPILAGERAEEFIARYRGVYAGYQDSGARLFPHTKSMLDIVGARGYKRGIVTSKVTTSARKALTNTGIIDMFECIVTADDVTHPKPDPEPMFKALSVLDLKAEDAIYVGDSLFDIDMAQGANVTVAAVSWGARSREDLAPGSPDYIFDTWQEFLAFLDE